MAFLTDAQGGIASISLKSWIFLILSGLATGLSWLCHYKALLMVLLRGKVFRDEIIMAFGKGT